MTVQQMKSQTSKQSIFFCIRERANVRLLRFAKPILREKKPTVLQSNEKQITSNLSFPDISSTQAVRNLGKLKSLLPSLFSLYSKFRLLKQLDFSQTAYSPLFLLKYLNQRDCKPRRYVTIRDWDVRSRLSRLANVIGFRVQQLCKKKIKNKRFLQIFPGRQLIAAYAIPEEAGRIKLSAHALCRLEPRTINTYEASMQTQESA